MKIPKKWLITGGCGFIGTNLIKKLISQKNIFIRVIDNLSVGTRDDLASLLPLPSKNLPCVELVVGDICDEKLALDATKDIDVIVHLAASTGVGKSVKDPKTDCMINIIGTLNYLEGARINKTGKFIFASSGAAVGECQPPIHEESIPHPVSPYGASKLAGEAYCSSYYRTFGIETIILRFSNVYGPGSKRKDSVITKFMKRAMNGETLEIYGNGNQTRDFLYIEDLIQSILLAVAKNDIGGEIFQIATSKETTVYEIAQVIMEIEEKNFGNKVKIVNSKPRPGDIQRNYSNISKARKMLGYEPKKDLYVGLKDTFEYLKNFKN